MFEIKFVPASPEFAARFVRFTPELKRATSEFLTNIIFDVFFPSGKNYGVTIDNSAITIRVRGIMPFADKDTDNYAQKIANKLEEFKFRKYMCVGRIGIAPEPLDTLLSPDATSNAMNAKLIKIIFEIEESDIPERFICVLSGEMMSNPAYLSSNPKVNYERLHLSKWINDNNTDPTTRQRISSVGIVDNNELRNEILSFLSDKDQGNEIAGYHIPNKTIAIQTDQFGDNYSLNSPATLFTAPRANSQMSSATTEMETLFSSASLGKEFIALLAKSLRRFANAGRSNEVKAILALCNPQLIIDFQDENPNSKQTALHYAAKGKHANVIQVLLAYNASFSIVNAQNKTAEDLILSSNSSDIIKIFKDHTAKLDNDLPPLIDENEVKEDNEISLKQM